MYVISMARCKETWVSGKYHPTSPKHKLGTLGSNPFINKLKKNEKKSQAAKCSFTSSRGLAPAIKNEIGRHANVLGVYVHTSKGLSENLNVVWPFSTIMAGVCDMAQQNISRDQYSEQG